MIDVSELRRVLRYENGRLFWVAGRRVGVEAGCVRPDGRVVLRAGGRKGPLLLRSRVVWALNRGAWPTLEIDHANCDPSDDRIENLREATSSQNKWNTRRRANNKAGLKGVHFNKALGKFCAQIQIDGRSTHLGSFESKESAHAAYQDAAKRQAGEFAKW